MRTFLTALTLGTTVLFNSYVAPAQAQTRPQHPLCFMLPSGFTVKLIDPLTVICKNLLDGEERFAIYRMGELSEQFMVSLIHVKIANLDLVSISEFKTSKTAHFVLEGRKFKKWSSPEDANIDLVNKYGNFVTILLDAREEYHKIPEF